MLQLGLTGAIMAWHDELNHLFLGSWAEVEPEGAMRPLGDLVAVVEAVFPGVTIEAGGDRADHPRGSVVFFVTSPEGMEDPVTEVFVNHYTAEVLWAHAWGEAAWGGEHVMPMIYVLHHSLHLGDLDGRGFWIMGVVVLVVALTGASWNAVFVERNWFYAALEGVMGEPTPYATENILERQAPLDEPAVTRDEARALLAARIEALGIEPAEYWPY